MYKLWLLICVVLVLSAGMSWYLRGLKPSILALQFCFTRRGFLAILVAWQTEGVARFKKHFVADYPYLVCYGLLGYALATQVSWLQQAPVGEALLGVLPWLLPLAAVFDLLENSLHRHLVRGQNAMHAPEALFLLAGSVATLKWLLVAGFLMLCLVAGVCALT
ncbi:hypothetical protein [Variovorax sp. HJSM1_2]|uniref:hypothetical protein n=1 Tax=Variovorax sp. HJSM1_2 TaxID=3366263 RepID=UPI003BC5930E